MINFGGLSDPFPTPRTPPIPRRFISFSSRILTVMLLPLATRFASSASVSGVTSPPGKLASRRHAFTSSPIHFPRSIPSRNAFDAPTHETSSTNGNPSLGSVKNSVNWKFAISKLVASISPSSRSDISSDGNWKSFTSQTIFFVRFVLTNATARRARRMSFRRVILSGSGTPRHISSSPVPPRTTSSSLADTTRTRTPPFTIFPSFENE